MIILKDLHNCQIEERNVIQAYSKDRYVMECYNIDNTITKYLYDNWSHLRLDMRRINEAEKDQVLFG